MGRPKKYKDERVDTAVRLPRDLVADLNRVAEERDLGRNKLIEKAIAKYLEELAKERV